MAAVKPISLLVNPNHLQQPSWGQLYGSASALAIAEAAHSHDGLLLVITPDMKTAQSLHASLSFFLDEQHPTLIYPDWETLPYDHFSPHREIVSQRLETLYRLPQLKQGILIAPVATVMQRLLPIDYLNAHSLMLEVGEVIDLDQMRLQLDKSGYRLVTQVMEQGEFAVRGSLLDLFPMGSKTPYRIDLFDDEIDTIRTFNPEDQRSLEKVRQIHLLPAREFPLDENAIKRFRSAFRERFDVVANDSPIYRDVSNGIAPAGIEYYQPLFFERLSQLSDYLPDNTLTLALDECQSAAELFWQQLNSRFEQRRHDPERPLLNPNQLFLPNEELTLILNKSLSLQSFKQENGHNFASELPPKLAIDSRAESPLAALKEFLNEFDGKVLLLTESAGRREALLELLRDNQLNPKLSKSWPWFLNAKGTLYLAEGSLEEGLQLPTAGVAVIVESQLLGERVRQNRRRRPTRDADAVIANLTDLHLGAPVVHIDHGVGRYSGMVTLEVGGLETEFLLLEYAKQDKLYVPVSALNLISRYSGSNPDNAPLHRLGGEQWQKVKRKATEKIHDVAAELLEIHAQRASRGGHGFKISPTEQMQFAEAFPFEETPDQLTAINAVQADMRQSQSMDRVVCGDVGFGKTEVAMRAAFTAANGGRQVAILVPTTLLAQQHYQNFLDRFADWPFRIESLSRFRSKKQQDDSLLALAEGKVDIIIGTHKLLQKSIKFKNLGLVIIDEEHRFGVRHKEQLKTLRAEVDILTLTATPIPRTLNMSLAGMRDLSIIATPPAHRHAIKTFVSQWQDELIEEACRRELARGGQIYFLHNEVKSIDLIARQIEALLPEAQIRVAHGQMREQELEQ
ncbi:MAG: transcription-repair coupling factor, partial [Gammaproteobacteria bacterium]|nr:transcription-repair coupling factor [Gammaproteobacteria bacterium]